MSPCVEKTPQPVMGFGQVMDILRGERDYEKKRWGRRVRVFGGDGFKEDAQKSVGDYLTFIDHYLTEAKRLLSTKSGTHEALDALRKVGALVVACGEWHGLPPRDGRFPVVNGHDQRPA